jgi:hypothetical protein
MGKSKPGQGAIALPMLLVVLLRAAAAQSPASPQTDGPASATVVITAPRPIDVDGYRATEARLKTIVLHQPALSSPFLSGCMENRFAQENAAAPGGRLPIEDDRSLARHIKCGRAHIEATDTTLRRGLEAFDHHDYAAALGLFQDAYAKMGTLDAALMLAKMHLDGLGTPRDLDQGIQWLRETAAARFDPRRDRLRFNPADPHAMNARIEAAMMLARIHEGRQGVARDLKEAEAWYAKAAEFGFVPALDSLGQAYLSGRDGGRDGVARDLGLARAYLELGAKAGRAGAPCVAAAGQPDAMRIPDTVRGTGADVSNDPTAVGGALARDKPSVPDALPAEPAPVDERFAPRNQAGTAGAAVVRVAGLRALPWESYRAMRAAVAAYEKYKPLAPDAMFSFAVLPPAGKTLQPNFKLRVRTKDGAEFPVALENGKLFQLPVLPDPAMDADFVSNFKDGLLRIGLLVHTRNIPPEKERLGDVRLRNEISQAIADVDHPGDDPRCWRKRPGNACKPAHVTVWYKPKAPAGAAWLIDGTRREALEADGDPNDPSYRMPINAGHLSNDAIIEFDYKKPLPPLKLPVVLIYDPNN